MDQVFVSNEEDLKQTQWTKHLFGRSSKALKHIHFPGNQKKNVSWNPQDSLAFPTKAWAFSRRVSRIPNNFRRFPGVFLVFSSLSFSLVFPSVSVSSFHCFIWAFPSVFRVLCGVLSRAFLVMFEAVPVFCLGFSKVFPASSSVVLGCSKGLLGFTSKTPVVVCYFFPAVFPRFFSYLFQRNPFCSLSSLPGKRSSSPWGHFLSPVPAKTYDMRNKEKHVDLWLCMLYI